jgi:hypothetical protein
MKLGWKELKVCEAYDLKAERVRRIRRDLEQAEIEMREAQQEYEEMLRSKELIG